MTVAEIKSKVFTLIEELNLNINKELLEIKLKELKKDRDKINSSWRDQLLEIEE